MKAAVYPGGGKPLVLEDVPDPTPGADDVILKVQRCGICGTDLHMTSGHGWEFKPGTIAGHEYAGEIVAVGSNVGAFKVGERITALPSTGCGKCEACYRGNLALCHNAPGVMGGYGQFICVPSRVAVKLPQTLSIADGALIEPLAIALHGVRMAKIQPGDRVLVLGAGSIALCAIYWAKRLGAGKIVAASRSARRADMACEIGADEFATFGANEAAEIRQAFGGVGPDVVLEGVGATGMLAKAVQHAADFARIISLGFCTDPDPVSPAMASWKGVSMQFCVGYTLKEFEYVARVMDAGHADPKMMISSVIKLDDLPATFERLRGANAETKVHVAFD